MARQYVINGESMVVVKGPPGPLGAAVQLGLSATPINIQGDFHHEDIKVDAYGKDNPPDLQLFGSQAYIDMDLVHFDPLVLQACVSLSIGAGLPEGEQARAGTLMGGGVPLYATGNNYVGVNILSPVLGIPWLFYACYLARNPLTYPLGTERSVVRLRWRAIAYAVDPWNGGTGSRGVPLYDHTTF